MCVPYLRGVCVVCKGVFVSYMRAEFVSVASRGDVCASV